MFFTGEFNKEIIIGNTPYYNILSIYLSSPDAKFPIILRAGITIVFLSIDRNGITTLIIFRLNKISKYYSDP